MMTAPNASMVCPRTPHPLQPVADQGIEMHACGGCAGLWVPKASLVTRLHRDAILAVYHSSQGRASNMRCPADGTPLWEFHVGQVAIDRCNSCGGLWFDAGELNTLIGSVGLRSPGPAAHQGKRSQSLAPSDSNPVLEIAAEGLLGGGIEVAGEVLGAIVKFIAAAVVE